MARGGKRPGAGRKQGIPNKMTTTVKEALHHAYKGIGGDDALILWAQGNQTEFYKLWGRMLPQEHAGPDGGPIVVEKIERIIRRPAN